MEKPMRQGKKRKLLLYIRTAITIAALSSHPAAAAGEILLKVGIHDTEPLVFQDEQGTARGFVIDVLEHIAVQEDWTLEYVYVTWQQGMERLRSGAIDLFFPIFSTEERRRLFDFNQTAIFSTWGRAFTRTGVGIESILDLEGKTIAATKGDIFSEELQRMTREFGLECDFIEPTTSEDVFHIVRDRQADVAVAERIDGHLLARKYNLVPTPIIFTPGMAFFAAPKNRLSQILETLDGHMTEMKEDTSSLYYAAYDRWMGRSEAAGIPSAMIWAVGITLAVLMIFLSFILILRTRVRAKTRELRIQNRKLEKEVRNRIEVEERLTQSLKEKDVMLKEIHHRVKNNMQIISSLLRLQAHATDSTKLQAAYEVGLNRIRSMALVHESLYRSQNLSSVDFQEYLQQMTGHLLSLYNHRDKHIDLEIKGGEIYLDISQAIPCGLIVNEIVSNSLKYAFPHNNGGRIEISLLNLESGKHSLTILDNGIGLPQGFDLQKVPTLGMQLIVDLVKQIDGILAVESSQGTVFKIIF